MGLLERLNSKGAPSLRLSAPTRLRVPPSVADLDQSGSAKDDGKGPALFLHVIDPSLILTEEWKVVVGLCDAARNVTADQVLDGENAGASMREQIAEDKFFAAAADRITDAFARHWFAVGVAICEAEAISSTTVRAGFVSPAVSSALTATTIELEPISEVLLAQNFVRDGYMFERMKRGGPTAVHLDFDQFFPDSRLAIFRLPWSLSMDLIVEWVGRFPLPAANRDIWLNTLMRQIHDEEAFTSTVFEAVREFSRIGRKAHAG